jgi:hypothetical protein
VLGTYREEVLVRKTTLYNSSSSRVMSDNANKTYKKCRLTISIILCRLRRSLEHCNDRASLETV